MVGPDGRGEQVGRGKAVPWPDGSRFVTENWDTDKTELRVIDTRSGVQRHGVAFEGLLQDLTPSPHDADVLAARQGKSTLGPLVWVIIDFRQRRFLDRFPARGGGFGWLPDGRFITVSGAGEVRRGTVGQGARAEPIGQLALPAGRSVGKAWVDPQGRALMVRLDLRPRAGRHESDLWIAAPDGSRLARYTATGMTTMAAWSPDGKRVAFDVDTGAWCAGSACQGICEVWHAEATARNVRATAASGDARPFKLQGLHGPHRMGCSLRGWTH
jgi:Tol biopolymer transport system component